MASDLGFALDNFARERERQRFQAEITTLNTPIGNAITVTNPLTEEGRDFAQIPLFLGYFRRIMPIRETTPNLMQLLFV
jgi:hypothetical protein